MLATAQSLSSSKTAELVVSRSAIRLSGCIWYERLPRNAFVPERLTVFTVMPAARLNSVASAPPLTTAT